MDDQARRLGARHALGVLDLEHDDVLGFAVAAPEPQHTAIADLAAALGVERGAVQDDLRCSAGLDPELHLGLGLELLVLGPIAEDRDDFRLRARRLVPDELGVARAPPDRLVERRSLDGASLVRLRPGATSVALLGEGNVEPGSIDLHPVLGRQLDGQVDREAVGVVELERDVARKERRVVREVLGLLPDLSLRRGQRDERLLEQVRARLERPAERDLLSGDPAEDRVLVLAEVAVEVAHGVDDDLRRLGQERLLPSEQPAVPDCAPDDPADDVAAALVGRQDTVGQQERRRPRVVGDDLVAEALRLERVRVVPEQLPHPIVDRGEKVRVVVRRDLLDDARQPLEAHARVDARRGQRGQRPIRVEVVLHEHEVPDLEPARAHLGVVRDAEVALAELRARGRSGSPSRARTGRCRPSATSSSRRRPESRPSGPGAPAAGRSRPSRSRGRRRRSCRRWRRAARRGSRGPS